jgi:DNA-binding transcriptional MerR regulator
MASMDIAEVARISGVPASALRYYEEKGLIASVGRRGLRRLFDLECPTFRRILRITARK